MPSSCYTSCSWNLQYPPVFSSIPVGAENTYHCHLAKQFGVIFLRPVVSRTCFNPELVIRDGTLVVQMQTQFGEVLRSGGSEAGSALVECVLPPMFLRLSSSISSAFKKTTTVPLVARHVKWNMTFFLWAFKVALFIVTNYCIKI